LYFILTRQGRDYNTKPAFTLLTALLKAKFEVMCGTQFVLVIKVKKIKGGTEWRYWEITKYTTIKDIWRVVWRIR